MDDLHERAGSENVVHLHGSLHQPRCFDCFKAYEFLQAMPEEPEGGRKIEPPVCPHCQGSIRPGVVWFGESIKTRDWQAAETAANACDVLFSIGTSSLVWPAGLLPESAALHGATVIQINPGSTPLDAKAHFNLHGKAGEVLPALVAGLG